MFSTLILTFSSQFQAAAAFAYARLVDGHVPTIGAVNIHEDCDPKELEVSQFSGVNFHICLSRLRVPLSALLLPFHSRS